MNQCGVTKLNVNYKTITDGIHNSILCSYLRILINLSQYAKLFVFAVLL